MTSTQEPHLGKLEFLPLHATFPRSLDSLLDRERRCRGILLRQRDVDLDEPLRRDGLLGPAVDLVLGDKEIEAGGAAPRWRDGTQEPATSWEALAERLAAQVAARSVS